MPRRPSPPIIQVRGNRPTSGTPQGPQGLTVLLMLYQEAMARGVELYVVGVERDAVRRPLHARGLAQLVRFDATVDAVIASLPLPVRSRVGSRRA
jgi:hypothetical protein